MTQSPSGWRSLEKPRRPASAQSAPKPSSAFVRLARVQVLSAAGDAMIAVALAGSLFFSIDPSAARWRVGLYLAFTVAPFAIVSPLIGPALDRAKGGRRMMMVLVNLARAVLAMLMISTIDGLLLFPLSFGILVGGKSFAIAKAALVPTVVRGEDELVDANSRLALLTGVAGMVGAAPAALASLLFGPGAAVALAMVTFAAAAVAAHQLPIVAVATSPADSTEKLELRGIGIRLAGTAMGILRGIVGYLTFLVAFAFRGGADGVDLSGVGTALGAAAHNALGFDVGSDGGVPAWQLGVVVAFNVVGMLVGSLIAPRLRRSTPEENILLGALVLLVIMGLFGAWTGDLTAAALVSMSVGVSSSSGKLAFDSIVQRDAPDANYGRSFARFETRFQIFWVAGALLPVIISTPAGFGFLVIGVAALVATVLYFLGSRNGGSGALPESRRGQAVDGPSDSPDELDGDLRPAYPTMNLRSPVRMPTGWTDSTDAVPSPGSGAPTVFDADRPPIEAHDPTVGSSKRPEEQLPLWDE